MSTLNLMSGNLRIVTEQRNELHKKIVWHAHQPSATDVNLNPSEGPRVVEKVMTSSNRLSWMSSI